MKMKEKEKKKLYTKNIIIDQGIIHMIGAEEDLAGKRSAYDLKIKKKKKKKKKKIVLASKPLRRRCATPPRFDHLQFCACPV